MKLLKFIEEIVTVIFFLIKYKFSVTKNLSPNHNLDKNLVISLTAKKSRFSLLKLVLSSIFNQTVHPNEIILWIDKKEKKYLYPEILKFKENGLKIKFCNNLKSYNKIFYLLPIKKNYVIT